MLSSILVSVGDDLDIQDFVAKCVFLAKSKEKPINNIQTFKQIILICFKEKHNSEKGFYKKSKTKQKTQQNQSCLARSYFLLLDMFFIYISNVPFSGTPTP